MWRKYKELIGSGVVTAVGIIYFITTFKIRKFGDAVLDSRSLPIALGIIVIFLGLFRFVVSIKEFFQERVEDNKEHEDETGNRKRVIGSLGLMVAYAIIIKPIGFFISSFLYLFFQSLLIYPDRKKNYLISALIAIIFSLAVYLVFTRAFSLALPRGILG